MNVTVRIWIGSKETIEKIHYKWYQNWFGYSGTSFPYHNFAGRFVLTAGWEEIQKFIEAIHPFSALTEILINDEWKVIKQ